MKSKMKSKITSKTKRILAFLCAVVLVATTFLGHWYTKQVEAATTDVEPVWLDGYENVTIKDFKDADDTSVALTPGTGTSTGYKRYLATDYTSFDNVLLSMKINFAAGTNATRLEIGGIGWYSGLWVFPGDAEGTSLNFQSCPLDTNNFYGQTDNYQTPTITTTEAGVDKFVGEEFVLQLAFDFGEVDTTTNKADLTLGVYINGNLAKTLTFTGCNMAKFGNYLNFVNGVNITYDNVLPPIEPAFPEGYEYLTIKDFKDADTSAELTPGTGTSTGYTRYNTTVCTSFEKVLLSMKATFAGGTHATRLEVGGTGWYSGLWVFPSDAEGTSLSVRSCPLDTNNFYGQTDNYQTTTITTTEAGVETFVGEEFVLQLAFDFGETDSSTGKADLALDVYINGNLAKSCTFTGCNMAKFGNYLNFVNGVNITYDNVLPPIEPVFPEGYEYLTIKDFKDADTSEALTPGTGTSTGYKKYNTTACDSFEKVLLSMKTTFAAGTYATRLEVGGIGSYSGLWVYPSDAEGTSLSVRSCPLDANGFYGQTDNYQTPTITTTEAGVDKFVGEEFVMQLAFDFGEVNTTTNKADLTLGVYINGNLAKTLTFTGCNMAKFGNYLNFVNGVNITYNNVIAPTTPDTPDQSGDIDLKDYEKVTYTQFGIADGEYTDVSGALKDETSVAGHVLCGDIQLKITGAQYTQIVLGGTDAYRWGGIRLLTNTADYFNVMWYEKDAETAKEIGDFVATLTAEKAGVDFNGEEFNLMMSTEIVEHDNDGNADDIKLGIWFNGVLYNNSYIYIDNKGPALGNYFLVSSEQAFLNADPELSKLPNKNFDKVTFSDFGLETDIYKQADGMVKSTATDYPTLDKTVFSGDFRLSDSGSYQIIYGGNSDWNGFRIIVNADGTATLGWYKYNSETAKDETQISAIINPTDTGLTSFTKETFNLKISTELVDNDNDGNINDIKLAIWFNDILYPINGSDYSIITDWGETLQNHFSVYQATAGTNVALRNDVEYQSNPCYYEDISSFRQDTGYTYPTLEGYVFGGWYADAEYTEWIGTDVTSGDAWAKFVEEDVLSAKTQVKVDNTGAVPADSTDLRLATTVDSLEYRKISFYLQKQQEDGSYGAEKDAATLSNEDGRLVYEKLYYIGSNTETMSYKPSAFSWQSEYFKTFTLTGIPSTDYGVMIKATPFWVTMDGTIVRGRTLETCVANYEKPGENVSTAVSYDFLGEDVMPITGFFGPYTVSESSDPLLLPDYNTDTYFKMIADLGVNLIVHSNDNYASLPNATKKQLELGEKYGIGIFVNDSNIMDKSETDMLAQIANYSGYKSFVGMHLVDEPGTSDYCSGTTNGLVSYYSNAATILNNNNIPYYSNMYPLLDAASAWWEGDLFGTAGIDDTDKNAYVEYIEAYYTGLNPKVISYDYYPFSDSRINEDGSYNLDQYFWNIDAIRDKARATGKPFWTFVQAGSQWNDAGTYFDSKTPYYPTEGEFNWNANTALAFGSQGIQYFPLVQPKQFAYAGSSAEDKMWDFNRNGLIGAWGNKTQWYDYAQSLNKHIAAIDGVLMNSYSKQIIAIGSAQSDTSGLSDVTTDATYEELKSITANNGAIIGYFDYCGKTALYVVNYDYDNPQDITLTFDNTQSITKIENAVTTEESASSLTLNMEAGEGILLVIE